MDGTHSALSAHAGNREQSLATMAMEKVFASVDDDRLLESRLRKRAVHKHEREKVEGLQRSVIDRCSACVQALTRRSKQIFCVDCGSRHTKIHQLLVFSDGSVVQLAEQMLRPVAGDRRNLPLGPQLLNATYADEFLPALKRELEDLGLKQGDGATILLGATGGVRKAVSSGAVSGERLHEFETALAASMEGGAIQFRLLTGDEEARYELSATQHVFTPFFASHGKGRVLSFSGGGQTCQFAYGEPVKVCSLDAGTDAAEEMMVIKKDASLVEQHEALASARAHFQQVVDAWWPTSPLPERLVGDYVGTAMHEDVAQLGFAQEFLSPPQVVARIDRICEELLAREGDAWARAELKWKKWASENRMIGIASAQRLRAILGHFDDSCNLYFAQKAPPNLESSDTNLIVSWPVGYGAVVANSLQHIGPW